jgi:predicted AAA+ superfamily ATPase
MAHLRPRALSLELKRQLSFWPILTLLGPRQSGKSTFLRELVFNPEKVSYVSLDRISARESATRNPEQFLSQFTKEPILIDEAHKAPTLFDEIKAEVDEDRRPGRFILTGSVRFSSKIGIRESFTGRSANLRFDSMTFAETSSEAPELKGLQRYLKKGGMPAACFLRDETQIKRYWQEWLDTTCQRDLMEYSRGRLKSDLAYRILEATSQLEFPSASEIAAKLKVDARRVTTHLEALEALFLIRRWEPDSTSVGKCLYLPFDCGLAHYFSADLRRRWQVWVAHQTVNQCRAQGQKDLNLQYNLTVRGSFVDFVFEREVFLFNDEAYPSTRLLKSIAAIRKRLPRHKIKVCSMTDQEEQRIDTRTVSSPWSRLIAKKI